MHIDFSDELQAFRREVGKFLDAAPTAAIREAGKKTTSVFAPFKEVMEWHRILHAKGWSAPAWPVEHGGTGWSVEQRYIFAEEHWKRDLPPLLPNGLQMVGPLIMELGTEEQKRRYLPGILSGEDYWTQGYSEPNAGSDLASLACSAVSDGDDYVINGQKIWTTLAHEANRMFMLVRTSREARKQAGITFLLLDRMDYPGMVVRPIVGLDGLVEQCEVFFDNVRVPKSGRVGAENDGWSVAKQLLKHERGGTALSPMLRRKMTLIQQAVRSAPSPNGGVLADDPVFQRDLGEIEAELVSYEAYERMILTNHPIGSDPGMPSLNKIMSTELTQQLGALQVRVAGLGAVPSQVNALTVASGIDPIGDMFDLTAMPFYLNARATSIYAGTNEIQRDLLARTLHAA